MLLRTEIYITNKFGLKCTFLMTIYRKNSYGLVFASPLIFLGLLNDSPRIKFPIIEQPLSLPFAKRIIDATFIKKMW
jgi:hypothetical protein